MRVLSALAIGLAFSLTPIAARDAAEKSAYYRFTDSASRQIFKNYRPPAVKANDSLRAIISFRLAPDRRITDVRAVRESGRLKAIVRPNEQGFRQIEQALVQAVKRSSPLEQRPQHMTNDSPPAQLLYVYSPGTNPIGVVEQLPAPNVPVGQPGLKPRAPAPVQRR